jgi:hypothetical protein
MSVHTLNRKISEDWRAILAEIGPQIADEGARCEAGGH